MAKNFIQSGEVVTLTAPYDRTPGQGALVGSLFGVSLGTVLSGADGQFMVEGVFELAKTSAQAWLQGDKIYWDNSGKVCSNVATVGELIGVAIVAAANPSSTGIVLLNESVPATATGPQATIGTISAASGACAGGSSPAASDVNTAIATAVAPVVTGINAILAALKAAGIIASA